MPVTPVSDADLDALSSESEDAARGADIPREPEVVAAQTGKLERKVDLRGEKFDVAEALPAIVLIDLGIGSDPASKPVEKLRALRQFIDHAIVKDQKDAFLNVLINADPPVEQEELNGLIEQIAPLVTGSPT